MKKFELEKGGSMIKKVFTAVVMVLLVIHVFTNKSDAADFQEYKEVNLNDYGIIKVADKNESLNDLQEHTNENQANSLEEKGTVTTYGGNGSAQPKISTTNISTEATTAIVGMFVYYITTYIISPFLAMVANGNGLAFWEADILNGDLFFNIGKVLTNQYELFDISFLIGGEPKKSEIKSMMVDGFQKEIPNWYIGVRNLAVALSLVALIYIGIRMALSVAVDERAKYKKMFTGWIEGLILMFVMQYIIIAAIRANQLIVNIITEAGEVSNQKLWLFEFMSQFNCITLMWSSMGERIVYSILLITLIMIQIKFFIFYFQRVLKVALYIIISPLVCMTYAIDKAGDGRAQGFNTWLKEFMMTIFIQPLHLVIYVIFVYTAGYIGVEYPILSIMFLILLDQSEKLIKRMFNVSPKGKRLHDIKAMKMVKKAVGE
jgi:hypothetical protein